MVVVVVMVQFTALHTACLLVPVVLVLVVLPLVFVVVLCCVVGAPHVLSQGTWTDTPFIVPGHLPGGSCDGVTLGVPAPSVQLTPLDVAGPPKYVPDASCPAIEPV